MISLDAVRLTSSVQKKYDSVQTSIQQKVKTNIRKIFLNKHFPPHTFDNLFNKNTVTISYSCDWKIKTIINPHDAKILYPIISTEQRECNFLNKDTCPLEQKCHTINVVYKAKSNMKPSKLSRKVCFGLRAKPPVKTISQCIQFHWQFLITNSGFWLVNMMLWKFDTLSKKRNGNDTNTNFLMKTNKNVPKKDI